MKFEIVVSDYTASVDEWRRAQQVPSTELPTLTDEQKRVARMLRVTEVAYARSVLAGNYGQERMQGRARDLGQLVTTIANNIMHGAEVDSVIADMFRGVWLVGLRAASGGTMINVPRELADDVLDSGQESERDKLVSIVRSGLAPLSSTRK